MFQFTTTNIVNSPWFGNENYIATGDKDKDDAHALFTSEEGSFYVKGVNNFLAENITAVYKAEGYEHQKASVTFDLGQITQRVIPVDDLNLKPRDIFRLNVYIGLSQGSNDAMYSNDFYFKGKPLMIDFVYDGDWGTTVTKLEKTIKRFGLVFEGEKMVDVSIDGTKLTLTAVNEYQRFKKAAIEQLDPSAYQGMGEWYEAEDALIEKVEGLEGFGTYNWILHNLRIPTAARNDMFGQNFEETPIVGALYDQYTIHYCANRGSLGLNAVGHQATSHTTHVFYVLREKSCESDVSTLFESAITSALGSDAATKYIIATSPLAPKEEEAGASDEDTTEKDEL